MIVCLNYGAVHSLVLLELLLEQTSFISVGFYGDESMSRS
jgi:hypothetical protein